MNRLLRRAAVAVFLGTAATALVISAPAEAARAPQGPTLSRAVGTPLVEGQKAFQANDFATALAKAQEADAVAEKTPFETYNVAKLWAMAALRQNDLTTATTQFNRAIDSGGMPEAEKGATYGTAMLLNYNAKDYAKAIAYGTEAAKVAPLDDRGHTVMLNSYFLSNDFPATEKYAKDLIAAKTAAGAKPERNTLDMLYNSYLKQNNQAGVREALGMIALAEPTPENWSRIIDEGFRVQGAADHHVLNLLRLKRQTNSLNAQEYLGMAGAAMKLGLAKEAKDVLEKGIAAGTVTQAQAAELMGQANTLIAKDEAALAEFERVAATSPNGEALVRLGETHYVYGRLPQAEDAIRRGIAKGNLKDLADAQMTLGIVLLAAGKKDEARQMFTEAGKSAQLSTSAWAWTLYSQT
jgi:tetratricopeptide (TPR) repeat protein